MAGIDMEDLRKALSRDGFLILGGFAFDASKTSGMAGLPACDPTGGSGFLILVGNAGGAMWEAFTAAPEARDGARDPLDRYTRRCITAIAAHFEMGAVFPFERPFQPFQQWAMRAGGFSPSPVGVLAHSRFGPWAGFRAALVCGTSCAPHPPEKPATAQRADPAWEGERTGPCPACVEKPCMAACPAKALTPQGYDVPRCLSYLEANPDAACLSGCLARIACPHGAAYRQGREQARFHMRAFTGGHVGT
ncbi:hypothetical protein [Breoghania sp.]|uniref:hypothetical protein n=1 Tax=Breoghania sp. TaxID=2065378 RepID=UPI002AA8CE96|nr:hypothetical protein [Breoghania sp.]